VGSAAGVVNPAIRWTTSALAVACSSKPYVLQHAHLRARTPRPSSRRTREIGSRPAAPSGADAARAGAIEFHVLCVMKTACARPTMKPSTVSRPDRRRYPQAPGRPGDVAGRAGSQKGGSVVDYAERLRRLVINDACFEGAGTGRTDVEPRDLDPKTLALVRLAALVAVGGAVPSYGAHADAAVNAGATAAEIVDVLVGVIPWPSGTTPARPWNPSRVSDPRLSAEQADRRRLRHRVVA